MPQPLLLARFVRAKPSRDQRKDDCRAYALRCDCANIFLFENTNTDTQMRKNRVRIDKEHPHQNHFFAAVTIAAVTSTFSMLLIAADYDVAILGGRVMDPETGFDAQANVGVSGDRIATITTEAITGKRIIDASGHVVTAGFIDQHFHWTRPLGYKLALRDGVTTAMDLEAGALGSQVDRYYALHEGQSQINYGTAVSHELGRIAVLDGREAMDASEGLATGARVGSAWSETVPNDTQMAALLKITQAGLNAGAIGVASTLGYMPGAGAREVFELQKLAAEYGRTTFVHTRHTPGNATTEVNGAQEILANAAALGSPASINHFNNPGWDLVQELLVRMREQGFNVWGEYYPYAAGSTTINAHFIRPEIWVEKLGNVYEETLLDPASGRFLTQSEYQEILASDPTRLIILYKMPPTEIVKWIALPGIVMGSDAMPVPQVEFSSLSWDTPYEDLPNLHPRTAGSHGKSLRLARDAGIPLMQVLASFSYNPARYLGDTGLKAMQERGRVQEGMIADITIFDAEAVTDLSTYNQGTLPTEGIHYVLVSGEVVVDQGAVKRDVAPGKPIRFESRPE